MPVAVYQLAHDDSPCNAGVLLVNKNGGRWCPVCEIHPDMQSTCLVACCPRDGVKLVNMVCPICYKKFFRPLSKNDYSAIVKVMRHHDCVTPAMFMLITRISLKVAIPLPTEAEKNFAGPIVEELIVEYRQVMQQMILNVFGEDRDSWLLNISRD